MVEPRSSWPPPSLHSSLVSSRGSWQHRGDSSSSATPPPPSDEGLCRRRGDIAALLRPWRQSPIGVHQLRLLSSSAGRPPSPPGSDSATVAAVVSVLGSICRRRRSSDAAPPRRTSRSSTPFSLPSSRRSR